MTELGIIGFIGLSMGTLLLIRALNERKVTPTLFNVRYIIGDIFMIIVGLLLIIVDYLMVD